MRFLLPAVFCVLFANTAAAQPSWPMFHGPRQDNKSPEIGLLKSWPKEGPKLLWTASLPGEGLSGYSSVSLAGNKILTAGNVGDKSCVFCLDSNGKLLWTAENGNAFTDRRLYPGTRSTPTIDGERVYDQSALGQLSCFDLQSGKTVWSRNILTDFEGENPRWSLAESPLVDEKHVYCAPGGRKGSIAALDKTTGRTVWTTPDTGEQTSYATARIIEQDGLKILLTMNAKNLLGVNADTGKLLFRHRHLQTWDINVLTPLYHEGHIFITSAAEPSRSEEEGRDRGAMLLKLTVRGQTASVEQVWHNLMLDNLHDSVLLWDGYLYGSSYEYRGGVWVCVRWSDGQTMWAERDISRGSLTFADGYIYRITEDRGDLALWKPTPEKYDIVSRFRLPDEGNGPFWSHPVVFGGRLYVRHGTFLYCYDVKNP